MREVSLGVGREEGVERAEVVLIEPMSGLPSAERSRSRGKQEEVDGAGDARLFGLPVDSDEIHLFPREVDEEARVELFEDLVERHVPEDVLLTALDFVFGGMMRDGRRGFGGVRVVVFRWGKSRRHVGSRG